MRQELPVYACLLFVLHAAQQKLFPAFSAIITLHLVFFFPG